MVISALSFHTDDKSFIHPVFANVENDVKGFWLFLYIVLELIQGLTERDGCAVVGVGHEQWLIADAIIAASAGKEQG